MPSISRLACTFMLLGISFGAPAVAGVDDPPPLTNVLYGFIGTNSTLTLASPGPIYYVVGDLIVNPGVTLSVEPGVVVRFAANRDTLGGGDYFGLSELRVRGRLIAQGTVTDSIRFLSTNDGPDEWGQIRVEGAGEISLRHCVIEGALSGVDHRGSGPATLADLLIRDCSTAINFAGGSFTARWITVRRCLNGIAAASGASGSIQACDIAARTPNSGIGLWLGQSVNTMPPDTGIVTPTIVSEFSEGVRLEFAAGVRNVLALRNSTGFRSVGNLTEIDYCTSVQNGVGFSFYGNLRNSISAHNVTGMYTPFCGPSSITHCDSWSNSSGNLVLGCGAIPISNLESFNPFFVNPAQDDYRLADGSIFEFFSTTGGQIGAYGPHRGPNVVGVEGSNAAQGLIVRVSPNPSRGATHFAIQAPHGVDTVLEVLDLNGRRVKRVEGAATESGLTWDGRDERGATVGPGIYYWRATAGSLLKTGRVVMVR